MTDPIVTGHREDVAMDGVAAATAGLRALVDVARVAAPHWGEDDDGEPLDPTEHLCCALLAALELDRRLAATAAREDGADVADRMAKIHALADAVRAFVGDWTP